MWQKNDEFMDFKAITDPKVFGKYHTIIWKHKATPGFLVTIHDTNDNDRLTNVKYHLDGANYSVTTSLFHYVLNMHGMEDHIQFYDLTSSEALHELWRPIFKELLMIENIPWPPEVTCFIIAAHLEEYYNNYVEEETRFTGPWNF